MLEQPIIQQRGFANVEGGFQVSLRCPYYRGIWASLIEGARVTVDGEELPADAVRWTLGTKTFATPELADATEDRWAFEAPALLTVAKPGGLAPGLHDVEVAVVWRWSYIPEEMQPTTNISRRTLVLVR